jgi:hypothetical protein
MEIVCDCRSSAPHRNPLPNSRGEADYTELIDWSPSRLSARILQQRNASTPESAANSALARRQAESSNDPLQIIVAVVLDLDPPTFFSVMNGHMRCEVLL